jgi:hypothetical protein
MVVSIFLLSTFFAGVLFIGKVWGQSTQKFKFGELGNTKPAIDEEILAANDKLADKIEKRSI